MKKSKFTEEQIAFALRQAETETPVAGVCRKAGISWLRFHYLRHTFATNLVMAGRILKR